MNSIIFGAGQVGCRIAKILKKEGHHLDIIDPSPSGGRVASHLHSSLAVVPRKVIQECDLWIIAAPTSEHLQLLSQVLEVCSDAKVIIEKPIYSLGQSSAFLSLLKKYPFARILVEDTYFWSPILKQFSQNLETRIRGQSKSIQSVQIEFSKNRLADEKKGRFVDEELSHFGYEWFHILSVLGLSIGSEAFSEYLGSMPGLTPVYQDQEIIFLPRCGIDVSLCGTIDGRIGFPDLRGARSYRSLEAQCSIQNKNIIEGSDFRYRVVEVKLRDGSSMGICFESHFGHSGVDVKNIHTIFEISSSGETLETIWVGNHFEESILNQIEAVKSADPGSLSRLIHVQMEQQWRLEFLAIASKASIDCEVRRIQESLAYA